MSLDVYLNLHNERVFEKNITHNLNTMAEHAGIYMELWRPNEIGIETASQLIEPLEKGLKQLTENPSYFKQFNASNGWGKYDNLVDFVTCYLEACKIYPEAKVSFCR